MKCFFDWSMMKTKPTETRKKVKVQLKKIVMKFLTKNSSKLDKIFISVNMKKLFLHAYRKSIFICFIAFFIKQNEDKAKMIFNIDDCSHLNEQNVFIGIIENENNQQLFDEMKNDTDQHFPFTLILKN